MLSSFAMHLLRCGTKRLMKAKVKLPENITYDVKIRYRDEDSFVLTTMCWAAKGMGRDVFFLQEVHCG